MKATVRSLIVAALFGVVAGACSGDPRSFVDLSNAGGSGGMSGSGDGGKAGSGMSSGGNGGDSGASSGGTSGGTDATGGTSGSGGDSGASSGGTSGSGGSSGSSSGGSGGSGGMIVVPKPGKPGFAIVGAGSFAKSTNYQLVTSVGDSPGGNIVSSSTNYKLKGGVIGTTQP